MHRKASDLLKCRLCIIHSYWRAAAIQHFGNSVISGHVAPIHIAIYVGLGLFTIGLGLFTDVISANYGWTREVNYLWCQQSIIGIECIYFNIFQYPFCRAGL